MSKRFRLQRPPSIQKIIPFIIESISELSTLRTNPTKENSPHHGKETEGNSPIRQPTHESETSTSLTQHPFTLTLSKVLRKEKYSNRPVSLFSVWGNSRYLDGIIQELTREYDGWLEGDYLPYFAQFRGQFTDNFIFAESLVPGQNSQQKNSSKLLLQYGISDTIFLFIKDTDTALQQLVLDLCQLISDSLFIPEEISNVKPNLVLCKIKEFAWTETAIETNWRLFETKMNSWRHFRSIEVVEVPQKQLGKRRREGRGLFDQERIMEVEGDESREEYVKDIPRLDCCGLIKELIRKQGRPEGIIGSILTGRAVSSIIKEYSHQLQHNTYLNILSILQQVIDEEKQSFELSYSFQFNRLLDQEINQNKVQALRRLNLYHTIKTCKKKVAAIFNNFGINGRYVVAKQVQSRELEYTNIQIQFQRQQHNNSLFFTFSQQYLSHRPLSSFKCKKMLHQLQQRYINDGCLQDLKQFLTYIISEFGMQLLIGDQLNGFTTMHTRIQKYISQMKQSIEECQKRILKLHNNEYVRLLEYNRKEEIAKRIKGKSKKKKDNVLEGLLKEKMENQEQKIREYRKLVGELEVVEGWEQRVGESERVYQEKMGEIERMRGELERIQRAEEESREMGLSRSMSMKQGKTRPRRNTIEIDGKQVVVFDQSAGGDRYDQDSEEEYSVDQSNQQKGIKDSNKKSKKGFWSCFGC